jgi:hypothetical protein
LFHLNSKIKYTEVIVKKQKIKKMKPVLCFCLIAVVVFIAVGEASNPSDSEEIESVEQPMDDVKIVKSKLQN